MKKSIWKYALSSDDVIISMPQYTEVICVHAQNNEPQLWAIVDPVKPLVDRRFKTYGTGHEIETYPGKYIGTFFLDGGTFVFHVFEIPLS